MNVVIDLSFKICGKGVLGCDHLAQGYKEVRDGSNPAGYRIWQECMYVMWFVAVRGTRSTETDYYHLANSTGGAAWDLKWLREGGHAGRAFTNAFIQVAVQETVRTFIVCKECNCTEEGRAFPNALPLLTCVVGCGTSLCCVTCCFPSTPALLAALPPAPSLLTPPTPLYPPQTTPLFSLQGHVVGR